MVQNPFHDLPSGCRYLVLVNCLVNLTKQSYLRDLESGYSCREHKNESYFLYSQRFCLLPRIYTNIYCMCTHEMERVFRKLYDCKQKCIELFVGTPFRVESTKLVFSFLLQLKMFKEPTLRQYLRPLLQNPIKSFNYYNTLLLFICFYEFFNLCMQQKY